MATSSAPVIAHCQGRRGLRSDDDAILYSTDLDRTTVRRLSLRRPVPPHFLVEIIPDWELLRENHSG
jgi:hypothetical protein